MRGGVEAGGAAEGAALKPHHGAQAGAVGAADGFKGVEAEVHGSGLKKKIMELINAGCQICFTFCIAAVYDRIIYEFRLFFFQA